MDIQQQIELQRKWIEIGEDTIEQLIEEGQPDEIIEYEREQLRKNEAILEQLLEMLQERLKNIRCRLVTQD